MLILVFGAAISLALRAWVDAGIILTIVVGSALLGFRQEYRASEAVAELRKRLAWKARVLFRRRAEENSPWRTSFPATSFCCPLETSSLPTASSSRRRIFW